MEAPKASMKSYSSALFHNDLLQPLSTTVVQRRRRTPHARLAVWLPEIAAEDDLPENIASIIHPLFHAVSRHKVAVIVRLPRGRCVVDRVVYLLLKRLPHLVLVCAVPSLV